MSHLISNICCSQSSYISSQSTSTSSNGCHEVFLYYGDFVEHVLATHHGRKDDVQSHTAEGNTDVKDRRAYETLLKESNLFEQKSVAEQEGCGIRGEEKISSGEPNQGNKQETEESIGAKEKEKEVN